ncbi:MAG TPA: nuclear transport factor 2 family protein [Dongiaceae bacterium]|nr:nuclear transport factor 2 family protein [Dongiaceae bacterium]
MWADDDDAKDIFAAVDHFMEAVAAKRLEETLAAFSGEPDCTLIGSEAGEEALGPAALRRFFVGMFARPSTFSVTWRSRRASINGDTGWFSAEVDAHMSTSKRSGPYRITGVLVRRDGRWLWQLYHGAEPR